MNSFEPFLGKLITDNQIGIGLYRYPEFCLLQANPKYMGYLESRYHKKFLCTGMCLQDFIPAFPGSNLENMWKSIAETGETASYEEVAATHRGDVRYWSYNLTPFKDGDSQYIVSMVYDITDKMQNLNSMEKKNEELKKTIEKKDELLLLITHELKTPLAVITSSIQTLELVCKNELTEKVKKYLNKIKQNAYRQLKLVNNILDNTRVSSGYFKNNQTTVEIVSLTCMIIDSIAAFAERKRINISFASPFSSIFIKADADHYERILLNLLSNAVKFTPEGKSIEVNISQVTDDDSQRVCIQVKDNGIDIPNDKKDFIFERFGCVDKILTRHSEGTGIGLYLVKMLVTLMDGEIKLESKEGIGSTFSLMFPLLYSYKAASEHTVREMPSERLITASEIEFSDIYFGA